MMLMKDLSLCDPTRLYNNSIRFEDIPLDYRKDSTHDAALFALA